MSAPRYFLVAGATGQQGGATVDALLTHPELRVEPRSVYALSRQATGAGAVKLATKYPGINIVEGDLNNPDAFFSTIDSSILKETGIYLAQAHGPTELDDAKRFINAAHAHGVAYFVYSSVDRGGRLMSDRDPSNCKTFSDKFLIEQHLRSVCETPGPSGQRMDYTILRPTWFADNAYWGFPGQLCLTGWRENMKGKRMQVTVVKDIGRWAAEALLRPDRAGIRNQALSIASDELSFQEVDDIFREHTGRGVPVTNGLMTRLIIWMSKDLYTMFNFIGGRPYGAERDFLDKYLEPTSFREWVKTTVPRK